MKLGKLFWSLGSLLINVTIIAYILLSKKAPAVPSEKYNYINENWNLFEALWKAEFLFMTMIAIGALYFAVSLKKIGWTIIAAGQFILLSTYPLMLGGYRNTPFELSEMSNQMAVIVFVFGNLIFSAGLLKLYISDTYLKKRLRLSAIVLSIITFLAFLLTYTGAVEWKQVMIIGPLITILYLINACYGLKIKLE
jgi:membrane-associated HD superfamily phosphohydrolase